MSRSAVLVASLGQQPADVLDAAAATGERPRIDYVEVARALDAEVWDLPWLRSRSAWTRRAGSARQVDLAQVLTAVAARGELDRVLAWGDRIGLGLAAGLHLLPSDLRLALMSARLTTPVRLRLLPRVQWRLDAVVTYSSLQRQQLQGLGLGPDRLVHLKQPVDTAWWSPQGPPSAAASVVAVGSESRDYATLLEALDGLHVRADLVVGSNVNVLDDTARRQVRHAVAGRAEIHVHGRLGFCELRALYDAAGIVVVPLFDVDYGAGDNVVIEAMAMGKAVIASRSRGQRDLLVDGEHGLLVPPGDPAALRDAVRSLLGDPQRARRLGRAARERVVAEHSLEPWVARVAAVVAGVSVA